MDERERQLADSWRMALDAAHDGPEAMRDIWPRRRSQLAEEHLRTAGKALRAFEETWLDVISLAEAVAGSDFASAINELDTRGR
ncbi:MAG TPA: hypothetical protein VFF79_08625 [Conexibacter sp.]|jgi:hypothetical protein|nr:hypothetical protein [Conexibacter sp.]